VQRPLDRFVSLSPSRQRQLIQTLLLVIAIRVALWTIRFQLVRKIVENVWTPHRRAPRKLPEINAIITDVSRSVCACARVVPGATCLTRALAAGVLLRYEGLHSTLRIGVARGAAGDGFRAHAWLECGGRVVVGGDVMADYLPLPPIVNRSN